MKKIPYPLLFQSQLPLLPPTNPLPSLIPSTPVPTHALHTSPMATATSTTLFHSSFLTKTPLITTPKSLRLSLTFKRRSPISIKAELNPQLVISLSTGLSLFLGRFVFFNFQRENVAKQGLPEQNGVSHFEAGDVRAREYASLLKSNDPVGFNIVDVLAWGSLGHIVAYYILATSSNGYDPSFFVGQ